MTDTALAVPGRSANTTVRRVFVLRLGELDTDIAVMLPGACGLAGQHGSRYRFPVMAYLLDLGERGWMLVDTGMADAHVDDPGLSFGGTDLSDDITPIVTDRQTMASQLRALGVSREEVRVVVNTHLHFDHCGNNNLFPSAEMVITGRQGRDITDFPAAFQSRYFDEMTTLTTVEGPEEIVPGVSVFPTPGHVAGHLSVLVHLTDHRPLLLCGDAIPNQDYLDTANWAAFDDPPRSGQTAAALQGLAARDDALMLFPHDADQARLLPVPAACFG